MDVLRMAYEQMPDNISNKYARRLSEINKDELPTSESSNSKKVTFADFPEEDNEMASRQPPPVGELNQLHRLTELRDALGRHALTERGISYLLPVNENKISVENVYKPKLAAVFGKDLPRKGAALFNHRPGEVSPRDVPRLCRDISETRVRNSNFISPREEKVPREFSLRKQRQLNKGYSQQADPLDVAILLPSSSLTQQRLRRASITIGPRVKNLLESFSKYADVTEDMDGVPPTRDTYRKRRNHENKEIEIPKVCGQDLDGDILKWMEKGDKSVRRK